MQQVIGLKQIYADSQTACPKRTGGSYPGTRDVICVIVQDQVILYYKMASIVTEYTVVVVVVVDSYADPSPERYAGYYYLHALCTSTHRRLLLS